MMIINLTYTSPKCTGEAHRPGKTIDWCCGGKIEAEIPQLRFDKIDFATLSKREPIVYTAPKYPRVEDPNIIDNGMDMFGVAESFRGTIIADKEGIKRGYDLNGNLVGTSTVKILRSKYNTDMDRSGRRNFYKVSTDFLLEAAEHYAKIDDSKEFKYRPTQDSDFVYALSNFFYSNKSYEEQSPIIEQIRSDIDTAVRELATQIKNGQQPDISRLNSTIKIEGVPITFNQLKEVQQKLKDFNDVLKPATAGSDSMEDWGARGLTKAAAMSVGNSLGGDLGRLYSKAIGMAADENMASCISGFEWLNKVTGCTNDIPATFGKQTYELFSTVRTQVDFKSAMNTFDSLLVKYNQAWKGSVGGEHLAAMRKVLLDANINLQWY